MPMRQMSLRNAKNVHTINSIQHKLIISSFLNDTALYQMYLANDLKLISPCLNNLKTIQINPFAPL